jgi:hypothetical protein
MFPSEKVFSFLWGRRRNAWFRESLRKPRKGTEVEENEVVISHEGTEKADVEEPEKDYKKE